MADGLKPLTSSAPGERSGLLASVSAALRQFELNSDQLLPAKVVSYDRAKNMAVVKPLIVWLDVNDKAVERNEIAQVPVLSLGGGAFHISFPLKPGDLGWIYAADRDLSLFKQSLTLSSPNTGRAHNFSDSMFVPDVFYQYSINAEDSDAMVIQSTDGATCISIRGDNIKVTAPVKVLVSSPLAEFSNNVLVHGLLTANGGFTAQADGSKVCTLPPTTTIGGINVLGHGHEQNGDSGRTSGGMET